MPFCDPHIITVPPDRFRPSDPIEVAALAQSLKEIGQLQPILVDKDMILRAGLHRLDACKKLEREVWYETEEAGRLVLNNPMLRRMAEYQENFRRKEFTPAEKNRAVAEIDRLMREIYGSRQAGNPLSEGWTQIDTAKKLGLKSHRTVSEAITVTKAIEKGVPGVADAKTHQEAMSIVKTTARMKAAEELAKRQSLAGTDEIQDPIKWFGDKLILGDCIEKMKELPSNICSMFVTDPPFGIELDDVLDARGETASRVKGVYSDREQEILLLIETLISEIARVGKQSCQVIMFCGIQFWHLLREWFENAGFTVHKKPMIWVKASTSPFHLTAGRTNNPSATPGSSYEAMIYAYRGGAVLAKQGQSDVLIHQTLPGIKKCHVAQKPISLMEEIISRFYHPGTNPLLIDPFAGSGSTLIAARRLGIRHYFGYELSPQNRERAISYMVSTYMEEQETPAITSMTLEEFE